MTSLLEAGFAITRFEEHRSIPWNALLGQMAEGDDCEWRLRTGSERLPLTYTLVARLTSASA